MRNSRRDERRSIIINKDTKCELDLTLTFMLRFMALESVADGKLAAGCEGNVIAENILILFLIMSTITLGKCCYFKRAKKLPRGAQVGGKLHLSRVKPVASIRAGKISLQENKENHFSANLAALSQTFLLQLRELQKAKEIIKNLNETWNFPPFPFLRKLKLYFPQSLPVAEICFRISIFLFAFFFLILP